MTPCWINAWVPMRMSRVPSAAILVSSRLREALVLPVIRPADTGRERESR